MIEQINDRMRWNDQHLEGLNPSTGQWERMWYGDGGWDNDMGALPDRSVMRFMEGNTNLTPITRPWGNEDTLFDKLAPAIAGIFPALAGGAMFGIGPWAGGATAATAAPAGFTAAEGAGIAEGMGSVLGGNYAPAGLTAAEGAGIASGMGSALSGYAPSGLTAAEGAGIAEGMTTGGGGGMWDFVDGSNFDIPGYGGGYGPDNPFDIPGGFDMPGYGNVTPDMVNDKSSLLFQYGPAVANAAKKVMGYLDNASGGGTAGGNILGTMMGNPLQAAFNSTPFLLALAEANRQGKDITQVTDRLSGLADEAGTLNVRDAALGPYNRETASGLDRLTSSLQSRGVYGSSFGNADIANYKTARDVGAGELGTKAMLGSLGAQGALLDSVLRGRTQANTNRNLLLGAGLNASGRLFEPQRDPFGLNALFGG